MSRIEKLIKELCPNGVEYNTLGNICNILDSKRKPISKSNRESGIYPYFGANGIQDYVKGYIFDGTFLLIGEDGSVINKDNTPVLNWAVGKIWVNNHAHILTAKENIALLRYIFYALQTVDISNIVRGTPPKLNQENLRNIEIPVPHLEIQEEIVRILDKFTDLTAELQAELQGRIQQYDFYRNRLLTYPDKNHEGETSPNRSSTHNSAIAKGEVALLPLSELGTFTRGKRFVHADVTENGYPCIHYGEMYTYYGIKANKVRTRINPDIIGKMRFAEKGDVVIVAAGENKDDIGVGVAWLGNEKPAIHDACFIFRQNGKLDPVYLSHFLRSNVYHKQIRKHIVEAKICSIPSSKIGTAIIPVPSLDEQKRIAAILDKFDTLSKDLTNGLPAEIEGTQQRYEYYRDMLLNFNELERRGGGKIE